MTHQGIGEFEQVVLLAIVPLRGDAYGVPIFAEIERRTGLARFGAPPVVVIGHDDWQTRFGGDPSILGRKLHIGRTAHTVVCVIRAGFRFAVNHGWWVPLRMDSAAAAEPGTGPDLDVFGRLAPGDDGGGPGGAEHDRRPPGRRRSGGARASRAARRPVH